MYPRDNAAQMAFNTLSATMVRYTDKGTDITMSDGTTIKVGASDAIDLTITGEADANYAGAGATNGSVGTKQFCEEYFEELRKDGSYTDAFGRVAAYSWYLDEDLNDGQGPAEKGIYNAMATPAVTFTSAATAGKVLNTLKGYVFGGTKLTAMATAATATYDDLTLTAQAIVPAIAALTGNGKVVEIYATANTVDDVQVISYRTAKITNITTDTDGNVTYTFSNGEGTGLDKAEGTVDDTIVLYGDFARGDIVTIAVDDNSNKHVYPTTSFTGKMTAYSTDNDNITVAGKDYDVAEAVTHVDTTTGMGATIYTNSNLNEEVIVTLDQYGYVVAVEPVEDQYDGYAQVKGNVTKLTTTVDGTAPAVEARFVLADGTVDTYKVSVDYNKNNGEYKIAGSVIGDTDSNDDGTFDTALVEDNVRTAVNTVLAANTVFAYELDKDGAMKLTALTDTLAGTLAGEDIQGTDATVDVNSSTASFGGKTILLTSNTTYVLYDGIKKTATVYEGALPQGADLNSGAWIAATINANTSYATANVVFGLTSDVAAVASNNYAYIVANDATVVKVGMSAYNTYNAYLGDGTTITLYDKQGATQVGGDNVYTWDVDCNVTGDYNTVYSTTQVVTEAVYNVVGDQIVSGGNAYNIENANVVYVDKTKTAIDGNTCVVVLEKVGPVVTKNALTIYVVG